MKFRFELDGFDPVLDELADAVEQSIRPAAQAAAQVIYDRAKSNVQGLGKETGNLAASIYQAYSPEHSRPGQRAQYHISWNHRKAPHGHLLEYGWIQRYEVRLLNGRWKTLVRPSMRGKPKPGRRASQAEKDAYYMPRKGGPKQHLGRAFMRRAAGAASVAVQAAADELQRRLDRKRGARP